MWWTLRLPRLYAFAHDEYDNFLCYYIYEIYFSHETEKVIFLFAML